MVTHTCINSMHPHVHLWSSIPQSGLSRFYWHYPTKRSLIATQMVSHTCICKGGSHLFSDDVGWFFAAGVLSSESKPYRDRLSMHMHPGLHLLIQAQPHCE
jgi:hypothetical protein